jgi:hypothetical protein
MRFYKNILNPKFNKTYDDVTRALCSCTLSSLSSYARYKNLSILPLLPSFFSGFLGAGLLFYEATNLRRSITVIVKQLSNSVVAIAIPKTSKGIFIKLENIVGFVASAGQ